MIRNTILEYFDILGLSGMKRSFDEIIASGKNHKESPEKIILNLLESEKSEREVKKVAYILNNARIPLKKEISEFDFSFGIVKKDTVDNLCEGDFIERKSNIVLIGDSGTGKTHLAIGISLKLIRKGIKIRYYNVVDLTNELVKEDREGNSGKIVSKLLKYKCIILDELGYLPFSQNGGQLLFHLLSKLYEKVSIIITTNLIFSEWDQIFNNQKLTNAFLDRLTHHCAIIETGSKSWRLQHHEC